MMNTFTSTSCSTHGRQLLAGHDQAAVAREADDELVRAADLGADRRRQAEAHRAEPAGVDPAARLREVVVLRAPHLVLADVGGDDRVALRRLVHRLDHPLRRDLALARAARSAAATPPATCGSAPTSRRGGSRRSRARGTPPSASAGSACSRRRSGCARARSSRSRPGRCRCGRTSPAARTPTACP